MSRLRSLSLRGRWVPLATLWALAGSLGVRGAAGQERDQVAIEAARARVDSLIPWVEWLAARRDSAAEAQRERRRLEERVPLDTFDVGPLRVASEPDQRDLARRVMEEAWDEWGPLVRGSEWLLEPHIFVFRYGWNRQPLGLTFVEDSVWLVQTSRREPRSRLPSEARKTIAGVLALGLPEAVGEWGGGLNGATLEARVWAARDLISAPSRVARECYRGDLQECWQALGLPDTAGAWERWYTPQERRLLVEGIGPRPQGTRDGALWRGCVEGGSLEACDVFLQDQPPRIPLSPATRASLLAHALRSGGPGALERLRNAEGLPIRERLAAAAVMPADSLAASWRRELLEARPQAWAGLVRSPLTVLAWVLLFLGLATRSTRWRLG